MLEGPLNSKLKWPLRGSCRVGSQRGRGQLEEMWIPPLIWNSTSRKEITLHTNSTKQYVSAHGTYSEQLVADRQAADVPGNNSGPS